MNIQELLSSGQNITVSIGIKDLEVWQKSVIAATRQELEQAVLSDKAETYPSAKQVAGILNVDLTTLWRWKKRGYLVPIEVGGKRRYRMSDIKKILNEGK